jgi:hypothetical protein
MPIGEEVREVQPDLAADAGKASSDEPTALSVRGAGVHHACDAWRGRAMGTGYCIGDCTTARYWGEAVILPSNE